jgi:hypothetical protein
MDWGDYLRDEAAKYQQLAEMAVDPLVKQELLDLAAVCGNLLIEPPFVTQANRRTLGSCF